MGKCGVAVHYLSVHTIHLRVGTVPLKSQCPNNTKDFWQSDTTNTCCLKSNKQTDCLLPQPGLISRLNKCISETVSSCIYIWNMELLLLCLTYWVCMPTKMDSISAWRHNMVVHALLQATARIYSSEWVGTQAEPPISS